MYAYFKRAFQAQEAGHAEGGSRSAAVKKAKAAAGMDEAGEDILKGVRAVYDRGEVCVLHAGHDMMHVYLWAFLRSEAMRVFVSTATRREGDQSHLRSRNDMVIMQSKPYSKARNSVPAQ
jgi:hypothetical protein